MQANRRWITPSAAVGEQVKERILGEWMADCIGYMREKCLRRIGGPGRGYTRDGWRTVRKPRGFIPCIGGFPA